MLLKKRLISKGFTIIELMIVIAIIGILAAVAIPKFNDLVERAKAEKEGREYIPKQITDSYAGKILRGEHKLRPIKEYKNEAYHLIRVFFEHKNNKLKFIWQMNDGTYTTSILPVDKVKIKIDESYSEPAVKFRWCSSASSKILSQLIKENVLYAIIICKEEDWPLKETNDEQN